MRKYPFILLSVVVLLFSSTVGYTTENAGAGMKGVMGDIPQNDHVNAFRVDKIIGSRVINLEGENIGSIDDLVLNVDSGEILYAALRFGGFKS